MTANVEHEGGIPGEAPREPLRGGAQVLCDDVIAMMMFLRVVRVGEYNNKQNEWAMMSRMVRSKVAPVGAGRGDDEGTEEREKE